MIKVTRIYFINDKQLLSNSRGHQSVMSTWKITLLTILQRNAICYINFTLHYYIYINETYNSCFCIQGIYIYIHLFLLQIDWVSNEHTEARCEMCPADQSFEANIRVSYVNRFLVFIIGLS